MKDLSPISLLRPHIRDLEMYQGVEPIELQAQKAGSL